jgi:hypothetical protein
MQVEDIAMKKRNEESGYRRTKVKDLVQALRADELILSLASKQNGDVARFMKELSVVLKPHGDLDGGEFLALVRNALKTCVPSKSNTEMSFLEQAKIKSLSLSEVRKMVSSGGLPTKSLLSIAEKNLGIPIGTLKKANRKIIEQRILGTIENIEKLGTIGRKAAE